MYMLFQVHFQDLIAGSCVCLPGISVHCTWVVPCVSHPERGFSACLRSLRTRLALGLRLSPEVIEGPSVGGNPQGLTALHAVPRSLQLHMTRRTKCVPSARGSDQSGGLCRCCAPVLTIAAALAHGRPVFQSPPDRRTEADAAHKALCEGSAAAKSDHLAILAAFSRFHAALAQGGRRAASQVMPFSSSRHVDIMLQVYSVDTVSFCRPCCRPCLPELSVLCLCQAGCTAYL